MKINLTEQGWSYSTPHTIKLGRVLKAIKSGTIHAEKSGRKTLRYVLKDYNGFVVYRGSFTTCKLWDINPQF